MVPVSLIALLAAAQAPAPPSPGQIAQAAPAGEWIRIADDDLLVMTLATPSGPERRIVIQLMPAPIASAWVTNIRRLAAAHWWDATSINRVQDNYVAQWGDASEKEPLPVGLEATSARDYTLDWRALPTSAAALDLVTKWGKDGRAADVYARGISWYRGFPLATDARPVAEGRRVWPIHCYGSVGVGRNLAPDAGTGAELYAVIGHAPRHLDRNIAVVGRVIAGMEYLSSLPRGTADLGFYEQPGERTAITSVRLASDLPAVERPRYSYLSTGGTTWPRYVAARRNREPPFFEQPADAADVCNIPVPIRAEPAGK
ncbi:peptidylprolyl isomerase [uncultured Sphingomonas sp.]|uniref:peptidylprolyl isomerase n=1 Tax=uncultured Sphingomonas sp. TaxID=158754 RepID=UPI002603D092|nr:peptidylprolyl isomerase [uncultured Sphingomonas sp.]